MTDLMGRVFAVRMEARGILRSETGWGMLFSADVWHELVESRLADVRAQLESSMNYNLLTFAQYEREEIAILESLGDEAPPGTRLMGRPVRVDRFLPPDTIRWEVA